MTQCHAMIDETCVVRLTAENSVGTVDSNNYCIHDCVIIAIVYFSLLLLVTTRVRYASMIHCRLAS